MRNPSKKRKRFLKTFAKAGLILLVVASFSGCAGKEIEMEPQQAESGEWLIVEEGVCKADLDGTVEAKQCRPGDVCMTRKDFEQLMDVIFAKCE